MQKVIIFGATSAIAETTARRYAAPGARLHLLGRDAEHLATIASDLEVRGAAAVTTALLDVSERFDADALLATAHAALQGIDIALFAHGVLPAQQACEQNKETRRSGFPDPQSAWVLVRQPFCAWRSRQRQTRY